jgi:hypothetical protein
VSNRVSQVVTELLRAVIPTLRNSQTVVEVMHTVSPNIRVSQVVVEVMRPNVKRGNARSAVIFTGL